MYNLRNTNKCFDEENYFEQHPKNVLRANSPNPLSNYFKQLGKLN